VGSQAGDPRSELGLTAFQAALFFSALFAFQIVLHVYHDDDEHEHRIHNKINKKKIFTVCTVASAMPALFHLLRITRSQILKDALPPLWALGAFAQFESLHSVRPRFQPPHGAWFHPPLHLLMSRSPQLDDHFRIPPDLPTSLADGPDSRFSPRFSPHDP